MDPLCEIIPRIWWPIFLHLILSISFSFSLPLGNETDRLSLLAFKREITNDPLGALSSWNESLHFCEWPGVACGRQHQRVVELDLHSSKLEGSLSRHIGNLSFLRILNLENNSFSHYIPHEVGRLYRLQMLSLGNNTFSGEIPVNVSRCPNLLSLGLEGNSLTGKLPAEIGSLSKLQVFIFKHNNLFGEIPPSYGNLSYLEKIDGGKNNLQGNIPNIMGQLKRLTQFSFGVNNLRGTIPPSIYNLSSLVHFSVSLNQLHGSLPPNLGLTLPNLETFNIHSNQFSGPIPTTLSNASKISEIQLRNNSFTGKMPSLASLHNLRSVVVNYNDLGNSEDADLDFLYPLANTTSLEIIAIDDNNFGGILPEILSNFSARFRVLVTGGNQLRGSIPTEIGNLISLEILGLELNHLTGFIPTSIGKLQNLGVWNINGNNISGNIPSSLGNLTSLVEVYLFANNLQGRIPLSLGNCQNLQVLRLDQNSLSGSIPIEVFGISSLSIYLDLSENQLTGSLPLEVGKLVNLGGLSVSKNKLSGEIPISLSSCVSLEYLNLERNYFIGPIPESLSSLRALQILDLSHNNLKGQISESLAQFKVLTRLDLSFNDLEGEVPVHGIFANAQKFSILGNKKLCGGIPQLNLSKCSDNRSTKPKSSTKMILVIAIPCGCLGLLATISYLFFYFSKKTKGEAASGSSWEISFRKVAYKDLLQATNGFSSANLIGAGSFGRVYEGILPSDGTHVAVKVFNLQHKGAFKSFLVECATLANVKHRNLVKVLTACSSIDYEGNDFKALVYEFMVNGSLEDWLHPVDMPARANEPRNLNLIQRLNIAIDVANALDYLHHNCEMHIVHCDLKPSNILLDGDMTAHVGDFGLARFREEASHQLYLDQASSVGLKGTIGYAAPEYGIGSQVSTQGDVYSYGILLLETFTGKRPTDDMFKDGMSLHNYVKMALPNRVAEVVDPVLLRENEETSAHVTCKVNCVGLDKILECLIEIFKAGLTCSTRGQTLAMLRLNCIELGAFSSELGGMDTME